MTEMFQNVVLMMDEATPSVNKLHGYHWTRKHRMRARWAWLVKAAILNARLQRPKVAPERVRLTIERWGARALSGTECVVGGVGAALLLSYFLLRGGKTASSS